MDQATGPEQQFQNEGNPQPATVNHIYDLQIPISEWGSRPDHVSAFLTPDDIRSHLQIHRSDETVKLDNNIELNPLISVKYNELIVPENLSTFIASLITGSSISRKRLHQVAVCARAYLDDLAQILPNGMFALLSNDELPARREQETRRYTALCNIILELYSFMEYHSDSSKQYTNRAFQFLLSSFFDEEGITSASVVLNPFETTKTGEYYLSSSQLLSWVSNLRWADFITHNRSGMTLNEITDLIFRLGVYFHGMQSALASSTETVNPSYTIPIGDEFGFDTAVGVYYKRRPIDTYSALAFAMFADAFTTYQIHGTYEVLAPSPDSNDEDST